MISFKEALTSPIGKKVINALSAIGAVIFVIGHAGGNLTLLGGEGAFNAYAEKLHHLGILLPIAEIGLVAVFLLHIVSALIVTKDNQSARSQDYEANRKTKGGPSQWSFASTKMIVSGLILLAFLIVHLIQFRFIEYWSPNYGADYYHDLYAIVYTTFQSEAWTVGYMAVMVFLGFHLRHGVWSMFQSLGIMNSGWKKTFTGLALIVALLVSVTFFILPPYMYFLAPAPA
jgi:succinate dehydrogenase / fumarate reductase cytochrome b subunit